MRRAKQLLLHTSAMTATSLLMRTIALVSPARSVLRALGFFSW